jgi:hypothetical protein
MCHYGVVVWALCRVRQNAVRREGIVSSPPPLLSIVIPTRNRLSCARFAVLCALDIPSSEVQVVVEDNSDSPECEGWLSRDVADPRITYHYSAEHRSMTDNYNVAVTRARGDYICVIGDDDGVNPDIIQAVRWAREQDYAVVVPITSAHFVWPDLKMTHKGAMAPGELRIRHISGRSCRPDPEAELLKCVLDAGQDFHKLPRIYYGIVRRELMDEIRARTGSFFPGVSPDLAAAVALANVPGTVCVVDYPLFLPGSSAGSNAGLGGLNRHVGNLREQAHLGADCEKAWSVIVPPFFSIPTIWAEAAVGALVAMEREDLVGLFNVPKLYAGLFMFHPTFALLTAKSFRAALRRTKRGFWEGLIALFACFLQLGCLRAHYLVRRFKRVEPEERTFSQTGIGDVQQAVHALHEYIRTSGWSFGPHGASGPAARKTASKFHPVA